ncbi:SDR family NAD(P)-dependent oxidoreductase [Ensifer adhaerens]|uniref:SDR family NAD(P)-dependent oxidoreductase n=1 Tax=Ensifer adhaerens TaxID=106592 RepID=UPI001CBAEB0F|nr:SDR family oxidoreductase [Ensifer adhaerens]MBZ7924828.1 SDR family oxidoreductase [Ensifer adhaerens]
MNIETRTLQGRVRKDLDGKIVLILGGAGAIGSSTARLFAAAGAFVIFTHLGSQCETELACDLLSELGPSRSRAFVADVTDTASLLKLRDHIESKYGRLDVLVNAAGYTVPIAHANLDGLTDEIIDRMFAVNWRGQFAAIRTFVGLLESSADGLIVSLSSIAAFTGVGSSIAYCAAKAGIDVMTKCLARALAPTVRVLAVSPGVVDTHFVPGRGSDFNERAALTTPLGRIATAKDIAMAILACATMLTYSTGHTIQVDGGRSL